MSDNLCCICLENAVKYTCPACQAQTCSATCVKRHKLRSECSGLPDPTEFITNKTLLADSAIVNRDYNYLLNLERKISLAKEDVKTVGKNIFKRYTNTNRNTKKPRLQGPDNEEAHDKRLELVERAFPHKAAHSIRRQNTLVVHLPVGMFRATQNKSGYDKKSGSYTWTVGWVAVDRNGTELKEFTSFRLKEGLLLKDSVPMAVLTKMFAPTEIQLHEFSFYLENCLKTPEQAKSMFALNPERTIAGNLKDMVVLEYPRIYIVQGSDVWKDYFFTAKDVFGDDEDSDSSDSSESFDLSDSSTDSDSLDLDSEEEPEEQSSKLVTAEVEKSDGLIATVEPSDVPANKLTDEQQRSS
ncbi:hypothetical protein METBISCDRAFT_21179 [Metschnikowia bicuspidata]|uniref:HIT-type domain-containing protein n=1 Tax=Metschnikowia bicuspidata TaxID=27322 RepID=A0A4P9ZIT1_9ASCO|nr:hypothetical protein METBISCDRAFT_21179 [Metschnikowia bicuspidata]